VIRGVVRAGNCTGGQLESWNIFGGLKGKTGSRRGLTPGQAGAQRAAPLHGGLDLKAEGEAPKGRVEGGMIKSAA